MRQAKCGHFLKILLCVPLHKGNPRFFQNGLDDMAVRAGCGGVEIISPGRLSGRLVLPPLRAIFLRTAHLIGLPVQKFLTLAVVPVLHRAVVAGDAAVDLRGLPTDRASLLFALQVAVLRADGIGR